MLPILLLALAAGPTLPPLAKDEARLLLIRHGQAFTNLEKPPALPPEELDRLTDLGKEQTRRAGELLSGLGVCKVLSSPAGRAKETAALLAHVASLPAPTVDPRLGPLKMGLSPDAGELPFSLRLEWWKAGKDPRPPGGESMADVGARVLAASREQLSSKDCRVLALVAHSEVIAGFLGEAEGTAGHQRYPRKIGNASLTVVDLGKSTLTVREVNFQPTPADNK